MIGTGVVSRVHRKWSREETTYSQWLREADPEELTDSEQAMLRAELDWDRDNPYAVAQLEAMVGAHVALRRDMATLADSLEVGVPRTGLLPRAYPQGTRFAVFARAGRYLLGRMAGEGVAYLLRPEWVTMVRAPIGGE